MTPNTLAAKLVGSDNAERIGKAFVRPFLRKHYARDGSLKGSSWNLTDEQVALVMAAWKARQKGVTFNVADARKAYRARKRTPKVEETVA